MLSEAVKLKRMLTPCHSLAGVQLCRGLLHVEQGKAQADAHIMSLTC